jgi:hypothetical protein
MKVGSSMPECPEHGQARSDVFALRAVAADRTSNLASARGVADVDHARQIEGFDERGEIPFSHLLEARTTNAVTVLGA